MVFCLLLLGALLTLLLSLFFDSPVQDWTYFIGCLGLTTLGLSALLTFTGMIGGYVTGNQLATAIMIIPLSIPFLLVAVRCSIYALGLVVNTDMTSDFLILTSISILAIGVSILLLPFLWKA